MILLSLGTKEPATQMVFPYKWVALWTLGLWGIVKDVLGVGGGS